MARFEHLKVLPLTIDKAIRMTDSGRPRLDIEGWASTEALDCDEEVIEVGFFDASLADFMKRPLMPWMHRIEDIQGKWTSIEAVKGTGYRVTGHLIDFGTPEDTKRFGLVEEGLVASLSVGFSGQYTPEYGFTDKATGSWHWTQNGKLREVSMVPLPANPECHAELAKGLGLSVIGHAKKAVPFQDMPLAPEDMAWDGAGAMSRMKKWAMGGKDMGEMDPAMMMKGFLWMDESAPMMMGSYKLGIADIVGGEPKAVWKGVAAAMARMGQADIPEADMPKVQAHAAKYYKKFGKPMPERSLSGAWEWKAGEAELLEEVRFCESAERLRGASIDVRNYARHLTKGGRELTQPNRVLLAEAHAALAAILEPYPGEPPSEAGEPHPMLKRFGPQAGALSGLTRQQAAARQRA
jgi:HK97 family phage prohead protease